MKEVDKKRLEDKLAKLTEDQKRSLYKQAARKRKAANMDKRHDRSDLTRKYRIGSDMEEERRHLRRMKRVPLSLDEWALQILDQGDFDNFAAETDIQLETYPGQVVELTSGSCRLLAGHEEIPALVRTELVMGQRSDLAVGDHVRYSRAKDGSFRVEEVIDRKSLLSRPDPHDARIERVIAANVDIGVVVGSLYTPPLSSNLIDRYLLAMDRGKIQPLICINKMDLKEHAQIDLEECMHSYDELKIPVIFCCALSGQGIDELIETLQGKTSVFVGQSGVGKSSLVNAIDPSLELETSETRRRNLKGRHTTVRSSLYRIGHGICVIDTPGVRSFGLWKMNREELRWYFDEFDAYADHCRFSDCTHTHEPGCAVVCAVEEGRIRSARYQSYLRMLEGLEEEKFK